MVIRSYSVIKLVFCTVSYIQFVHKAKQTLEKPEGVIKNGQSREILDTQDTGRRQKKNRTQKTKMMSNTDPRKKTGWTQLLAKG